MRLALLLTVDKLGHKNINKIPSGHVSVLFWEWHFNWFFSLNDPGTEGPFLSSGECLVLKMVDSWVWVRTDSA